MVGLARLDNVQQCIETLVADEVRMSRSPWNLVAASG
jgi:hypothetical protein